MLIDTDYKQWLIEIKAKIRAAQVKAALAINSTVIEFYWDLGKMITEKQTAWGTAFLVNLSKDLSTEFPDMKGFSLTNLKYCKLFFTKFSIRPQAGDELKTKSPQPEDEILFNLIKQIPWGHIKLIIDKLKIIQRSNIIFNKPLQMHGEEKP